MHTKFPGIVLAIVDAATIDEGPATCPGTCGRVFHQSFVFDVLGAKGKAVVVANAALNERDLKCAGLVCACAGQLEGAVDVWRSTCRSRTNHKILHEGDRQQKIRLTGRVRTIDDYR